MNKVPKYKNNKVVVDGIKFDSKLESSVYLEIKKLNIQFDLQPKYMLVDKFKIGNKSFRAIDYKADFCLIIGSKQFVIDVKGMETPIFKLKSKLFAHKYGFEIIRIKSIKHFKEWFSQIEKELLNFNLIKFKGIELEEGTFTRENFSSHFRLYDLKGKEIYLEDSDGYWCKNQYDENRHCVYWENSTGYWVKYQLDDKGNQIYYEDSDGFWRKSQYDDQGNEIYWENSEGYWEKCQYDDQRNEIYWEDSTGYWIKRQYDENGNVIYWENSFGTRKGAKNG